MEIQTSEPNNVTPESSTHANGTSMSLVERYFSKPGIDPYDEHEWETRTAIINKEDGSVAFIQENVEFPKSWSQLATNIVTSKYFSGKMDTLQREYSLKQLIDRVVNTITRWGFNGGYFNDNDESQLFNNELKWLLINQYGSFNSPVYFNVGVDDHPQCSACQPYNELVSTPQGMLPIGRIVEEKLIGIEVFDSQGTTKVVAVKFNGHKEVFRVHLKNGQYLEFTGDHVVKASYTRRTKPDWLRVDQLKLGMKMHLHPHISGEGYIEKVDIHEAALAGWCLTDGYVGLLDAPTIELETINDDERNWIYPHLKEVFPHKSPNLRSEDLVEDPDIEYERCRFHGKDLLPFIEKYGLLKRKVSKRVPQCLFNAQPEAVISFLRSVFQADGYINFGGENSFIIGIQSISEKFIRGIQSLLLRLGIYSRINLCLDSRVDRYDGWRLSIGIQSERERFAEIVGFISKVKTKALSKTLLGDGKNCGDLREETIVDIESIGSQAVYDIQTESGEYLSNNVAVHNCFLLKVEDNMGSILEWYKTEGKIFCGGSGSGINLSSLRSSKEQLSKGGYSSGPLPFMRTADISADSIKSGGKHRRSAKLVCLNIDHPDVLNFIRCKIDEESKAKALIVAGYDGSVGGVAYGSVAFQNANNSVRVTDEFMEAVEEDNYWETKFVTTGEVCERFKAKYLLHQIAEAAWQCGDPGLQFDTTINNWHTCPNSGRITTSNPCSEALHLDNSSCNLASLNIVKFLAGDGKSFDVEAFKRAVRVFILAQDIIVGYSSYPTKEIECISHDYRQIGLGYTNMGAAIMLVGLPYDSTEGRNFASAVTALMGGEAYAFSGKLSHVLEPFMGFYNNDEEMTQVIEKHRSEAHRRLKNCKGLSKTIAEGAKESWDNAVDYGQWRNSQTTLLAPTGTISFFMDCDTFGVEPDIALVKYKNLTGGGGQIKIVNKSIYPTLQGLGYPIEECDKIVEYIENNNTIEGAPGLKKHHLSVFDCAFKPENGERTVSWQGHVKMVAAVQPFLSGAISKTINMPANSSVEDIEEAYKLAWKLGLKAISVYRDGSKGSQPLSTSKSAQQIPTTQSTYRRKLSDERKSITHKFDIAGNEGYIIVGLYDDGTPGEVFIQMSKEGSTISGLTDSFATALSFALQYGVPLDFIVRKFSDKAFEPSGFSKHPQIGFAKSIVDYTARWLGLKFLGSASSVERVAVDIENRPNKVFNQDGPPCIDCGNLMVRSGTCYKCLNCGTTSGCS